MKNQLFAMLITALLCVSFAGCTNRSPKEGDTPPSEAVAATTITEGEKVTIDGIYEFTIDSVDITKKPEQYFEAEDGKVYVDIRIPFQNSSDESVSAHYIAEGLLVYAGTYEYTGFTKSEEDDQNILANTYGRMIHASDTEYLHYLFSVPEEVQDGENKLMLNLTICDHPYQMMIRDGAEVSAFAETDSENGSKTSGEIVDGELVTTDQGEFFVDYAQITDKIVPTKAGDAYAYYAPEEGDVFLDFCIAYKNTSQKQVSVTKAVSATLKLDDESSYKASHLSESGGRRTLQSDNEDIIPLETRYMHCVFSVPEEAVNGETIEITFKIGKNKYQYSFTPSLHD